MKTAKKTIKRAVKFLPLLIAGLFLSNLVLARTAQSVGPEFNIFPNDPKTLRVANSSRHTDWQTETQASAEETVSFLFYYHNGIEGTSALNTHLRVALPTSANQSITATGSLWANNTAKIVTDAVAIQTDQPLNINYIPGTTKWYKDGSQTALDLPDGITSADGISIGNIQGCWPYAGYVVFQAKLKSPAKPALAIEKKVANSTKDSGTYNWQKQTSAKTQDVVAFSLFVYNPGNAKLDQVKISDLLPDGLEYIPGTTVLYRGSEKTNLPDGIVSGGITVNNLNPGINCGFYIVFKAKVTASGNQKLTNCAEAKSGSLYAKGCACINVIELQILNLDLEKNVRNVTDNQDLFLESTEADPGDIVEFKIVTQNTGNATLENINLTDLLPDGLIFQSAPQGIASGSTIDWHWDNLAKGTNQIVYLRAKVKDLSPGNYRFVNTAKVKANAVSELIDQAYVLVKVTPPTPLVAKYYLDKKVLNVSKGDNLWLDNNEAYAGDILEYRVYFKNIGEKTETVKLSDDLPQVVSYIDGSGKVKVAGKTYIFSGKFFTTDGLKFVLAPDQEGTINFRVKISSSLGTGSIFKNTTYLVAPSISLSDYVITRIKARPTQPEQPEIVKPQALPSTGAWSVLPASIMFALANYVWFEKTKKILQ